MGKGRKPGPNYEGPRNSRNKSDAERKKAALAGAEATSRNAAVKRKAAQDRFFTQLAKHLVISTACKAAKVGRVQYYKWIKNDRKFKKRLDQFWQAAVSHLEGVAFRIATHGVRKKSYAKGAGFYFNREYPTDLIKFILAARKPNVYGTKVGISVDVNEVVKFVLPHNNRDTKPIVKATEPCGAKSK